MPTKPRFGEPSKPPQAKPDVDGGDYPKTNCKKQTGFVSRGAIQVLGSKAPPFFSHQNTDKAHKLARILYNLMRHGIAPMRKEEAAYAEQVGERLEKQLHRRARALGCELKRILETVTMPDGEVVNA